jgi:hypothetical protein
MVRATVYWTRVLAAIAIAALGVGVAFALVQDAAGFLAAALAAIALAPVFRWAVAKAARR